LILTEFLVPSGRISMKHILEKKQHIHKGRKMYEWLVVNIKGRMKNILYD